MNASIPDRIIMGTRGSTLALSQAEWVAEQLRRAHPQLDLQMKVISTHGDRTTEVALHRLGSKGVFVKEIEEALLENEIDVAVHSLKDLPTRLPERLCIPAIPEREDAHDLFILNPNLVELTGQTSWQQALQALSRNATIGTSSLRRRAQLLNYRGDLRIIELRGNVDTRLRKLRAGDMHAIILAWAGIRRLPNSGAAAMESLPWCVIPYEQMLPAPGQGALAVQTRSEDETTIGLMSILDHKPSRLCVTAERALLEHLEGGCNVPVGAFAEMRNPDQFHLRAIIATTDGQRAIRKEAFGHLSGAQQAGVALAEEMLNAGGREILGAIRSAPAVSLP